MDTQANLTPDNPMQVDLRRRSKGGCIDCKAAKVRCDETRPACGTCARRKRRCRGYQPAQSAAPPSTGKKSKFMFYHPTDAKKGQFSEESDSNPGPDTHSPAPGASSPGTVVEDSDNRPSSSSSSTLSAFRGIGALSPSELSDADLAISCRSFPTSPSLPQSISIIPPGTNSVDDVELISLYFRRHPFEQVISFEFVDEMNASTWMLFQNSPEAVAGALCSVGAVYLEEDSQGALLPLTIARRARTLATLKNKDPSRELEIMLLMSLALGAMEGIDTRCKPHERTSSTLIAFSASIINRYLESGLLLSSLAKYFIRALARHDMIMSISHLHRNSIKTEIWLDEHSHTPDRFMGYTTTLMPLLEELCGLAEDVRHNAQPVQIMTYGPESPDDGPSITCRANDLRSRIESWQWGFPRGVSEISAERLLAHADAYRTAALLMLYRLLHPAGSSAESDWTALKMAEEIMGYLRRPTDELGLFTWPAMVAGCELLTEMDRMAATNVFHSIYRARKTGTSLQTLKFVTDRVWRARDEGLDWNWMTLSQRFPGECVPL